MRIRRPTILVLVLLLLATVPNSAAGGAETPRTLFDPDLHMRVDEVCPGMRGYGLSVFSGTKIERFEVEVLSVLDNFNPKRDVILVRCAGANLEHTGSIAGMSGSPIYLTDERGRTRMAGAFAYGWPMMKDPVGGVQPIEYMLELRGDEAATKPAEPGRDAPETARGGQKRAAPIRWRVDEAVMMPWARNAPPRYPFASTDGTRPNPRLGAGDDANDLTRLRPLATPLMTSGMSPKVLDELSPVFKALGLVPLQAGGIAGGATTRPAFVPDDVKLEPGSTLAVPLLTGDVDMTAIGTTTEVLDGHVFGFGHAFMSEGPVSLPMGSGWVQGVIANLMTSFKLGAMADSHGSLYTDELTGVAGRIGPVAPMVPIRLNVKYADGSLDETYTFQAASHPRFTPLLAITAVTSAVTGEHELPQFHTMDYALTASFENGRSLEMKNTVVNSNAGELFFEIGGPMMAAAENPFERVLVKEVTGTVTVRPEAREARILSVHVPRLKHRPGETVKAFVRYRPFRAGESTMPVSFELPRDLPEGQYQLTISDWMQYLTEEQAAKPFRFTAESIEEVFDVMRDLASVRHDALYVRLNRQPDGVAVGRTAMPNLPSSRREVLIGAGRSNTTPFVSATVKSVPTEFVMSGSAQFVIEIDRDARVERGGAPGAPGTAKPQQQPAATPGASEGGTGDEGKPSPKPSPSKPDGGGPKPDAPAGPPAPAAPEGGAGAETPTE